MADSPTAGKFEAGVHVLPVRVYHEDTDFSGAVYHASYLRFLERGRSDALRCAGFDHGALAHREEPLALVVRGLDVTFLRPARIDDALEVRTSYAKVEGARIIARQDVFRGKEHLVRARVEVAMVAPNGRPRRLPPDLVAALNRGLNVEAGAEKTP